MEDRRHAAEPQQGHNVLGVGEDRADIFRIIPKPNQSQRGGRPPRRTKAGHCGDCPGALHVEVMTVRTATCRCGQLRATCTGEPIRVSVCHCLACQRRSGSAFAAQARWPDERVSLVGDFNEWSQAGDSGSFATFRFCATCGATVAFRNDAMPGETAIAIGAFADPGFPPPKFSVYEERKHGWVTISGDDIEHFD